jgi:crotonobetainyl-CoA:carnitine CoA-transferase CaiB-like acyl-CoA transferase
VPVAPVNSLHDLLGDPQLAARDFWGSLINTSGQTQRIPLSPLARLFGSNVASLRVSAPGAQTHTVLASLETA